MYNPEELPISHNNFNETPDMIKTAEQLKTNFGSYGEAVTGSAMKAIQKGVTSEEIIDQVSHEYGNDDFFEQRGDKINQLELDTVENEKAQAILAERGLTTLEFNDITDNPELYSEILAAGKKANKHGHLVWYHSPDELKDGRKLYATEDGGVCISVCPDGDVCSFVRNPEINPDRKGIIPSAMAMIAAVNIPGIKHLHTECYGEATARAYEKIGFKVIGYYGWDKGDQPSDWPDEDTSKPNMYFMVHNGDSASEIAQKFGTDAYDWSTDEELKSLPNFGPKRCPEIYEYSKALRNEDAATAERILQELKNRYPDLNPNL